ncbi:hypothetical protein HDE79_002758 [Rhodanobacter sp. MP1X3]|nr:hypothetical protein [Rhodanobacter sp. MP1X3]
MTWFKGSLLTTLAAAIRSVFGGPRRLSLLVSDRVHLRQQLRVELVGGVYLMGNVPTPFIYQRRPTVPFAALTNFAGS